MKTDQKGGEELQSMEEIYQHYAKTVYHFLLARTGNDDLAEELTQETFYQAIRSIDRYDENCKISTWLCGIAKNVLLTYLRKHPETEDLDGEAALELRTDSAEQDAIDKISRIELMRKLHDLEEPYREVMYLRALGGLSFAEIGEVQGKSENWARVTFYRAKEKLRKEEI
jgi:RNA polymerase sigma-70 factor (ECF subfamily)